MARPAQLRRPLQAARTPYLPLSRLLRSARVVGVIRGVPPLLGVGGNLGRRALASQRYLPPPFSEERRDGTGEPVERLDAPRSHLGIRRARAGHIDAGLGCLALDDRERLLAGHGRKPRIASRSQIGPDAST